MPSQKIDNNTIMTRLDAQDQRMGDIYDLLKQHHEDLLQFRTDATRRLSRLEDRVDSIYDERKQVTVQFTRSWAGASVMIAFFASFFSLGAYRIFFA